MMAGQLEELIARHHDAIVARWAIAARCAASARGLEEPELLNIVPKYVSALADRSPEGEAARLAMLNSHFGTRVVQGFYAAEIVEELAMLGQCIAKAWADLPEHEHPAPLAVEGLMEELQRAGVRCTEMFVRHMLDEEQTVKRYLRLFGAAAARHRSGGRSIEALLHDLIALVVEALGAQTGSLLLYDAQGDQLCAVASAGLADELLEDYATSSGAKSLPAHIATERDGSTEVSDVATTLLEVSDTLRQSGIHAVLGVRLPPHSDLLGVMYVGLSEQRKFSDREIARIEALASGLVVVLENAQLHERLRTTIARLESEKAMRERFVALLAHDLRGPLSVAKMSAQLLLRHPEMLDARVELARKIDRNIDRTDQMVRDLLDANRIRAGEPLTIHPVECDLCEMAKQVVEDLSSTHGRRFRLLAPGVVSGQWDADLVRRAVWNLGANAAKHGAPGGLVTIRIAPATGKVRISVHNLGPVITAEDQLHLFDAVGRPRTSERSGWGLGLTLVRGVAEAHGGRVDVHSTAEHGTRFTLELPMRVLADVGRSAHA